MRTLLTTNSSLLLNTLLILALRVFHLPIEIEVILHITTLPIEHFFVARSRSHVFVPGIGF